MKRMLMATAVAMATLIVGITLAAQQVTPGKTGGGGSPHETVAWTIDGAKISIEYGRPSLKGRTPGKDVEPMDGKEWRTGADAATTLKTDKMLMIGSLHVPAGTYTLYTISTAGAWQLIVSKKTGQWGVPYPTGEDLGRVPMTVTANASPVERLTFSITDTPAGGTLHIDWGKVRASVPFTVGS
jgi:hypothetical protein